MGQSNNTTLLIDKLKNSFLRNKKSYDKIIKSFVIGLFVIMVFLFMFLMYSIVIKNRELNKNIGKLLKYNQNNIELLNIISNNEELSSYIGDLKSKIINSNVSIYDLIKIEKFLDEKQTDQKKFYLQYLKPYIYFLQYIYLPSMNIWKDPFTGKIDINKFGEEYLKSNPYIDTNLLNKWYSFFSKSYNGSINDIKNLTISDLQIDDKTGIFTIPIDVDMIVENRKNFLALLSKLIMTSNAKTIMYINEFTYSLWKQLLVFYNDYKNQVESDYKKKELILSNLPEGEFINLLNSFRDKKNNINLNKNNINKINKFLKNVLQSKYNQYKKEMEDKKTDSNKKKILSIKLKYIKSIIPNLSQQDIIFLKNYNNNNSKLLKILLLSKINFIGNMHLFPQDIYDIEINKFPIFIMFLKYKFNLTQDELEAIYKDENPIDKFIGLRFYKWIGCDLDPDNTWTYNACDNIINIPYEVVKKAIFSYAKCQNIIYQGRLAKYTGKNYDQLSVDGKGIITQACAEAFRRKMIEIPYIAYTLGYSNQSNDDLLNQRYKKALQDVYKNIPPLIQVGKFDFSKIKTISFEGEGYQVRMKVNIYGKSISNEELLEIKKTISLNCFVEPDSKQPFTIEKALQKVNKKLSFVYKTEDVDADTIYEIELVKKILEDYKKGFDNQTNFNKIISLIEAYRTLKSKGYCDK